MKEYDVIIIGGGPVGLTLAISLGQRNISVLLLNERRETTDHPRLDVLNPRTMEIYRRLGLADAIRAVGTPLDQPQTIMAVDRIGAEPVWMLSDERHLLNSTLKSREVIAKCSDGGELPLEPMHRTSQIPLERVLKQAADAQHSVDVRFSWRMTRITQDADGVTVWANQIDGKDELVGRAKYAIGCDGPRSPTRASLGIERDGSMDLVGQLVIIHFRSTKLREHFPNGVPAWHTWSTNRALACVLVCPNGDDEYVMHKLVPPKDSDDIVRVVRELVGSDVDVEILQHGIWQPQFLVAKSFGAERIWLAGDATHQYMPTGGMGLNTGVVEADNLSWKIAAMLEGWGGAKLMESYDAERRPIAFDTREHVRRCAAASLDVRFSLHSGTRNAEETEALRRQFDQKLKRLYTAWGAEFGYCYLGSPVIDETGEQKPFYDDVIYKPTTRPGSRLPSVFRATGEAILDQLNRFGFTLITMGDDNANTGRLEHSARQAGVPLSMLRVTEPHIRKVYERDFVLVRPDDIVAWRGDVLPRDPKSLVDLIRGAI